MNPAATKRTARISAVTISAASICTDPICTVSPQTAMTSSRADPRWVGIIEVLVWGLAGAVQWEPDSVVLQLPDYLHPNRVADLNSLRLCLKRLGMPVVFDPSGVTLFDDPLVDFLKQLVECGLMVNIGPLAA
jgi:hypothetical protein